MIFVKARLALPRQPNVHHLILPLSLLSQTALGIMTLGIQSQRIWADTKGPATAPLLLGEMAIAAGALLGVILWASAAAWFVSAHLAILLRTTSPRNMLRKMILLVTTRIVAFPMASFAMATAALARIWHSMVALALTKVLLVFVGVILTGIYAAMIWSVCSFIIGLVVCRKQMSAEEPDELCSEHAQINNRTVSSSYGSI
ncbi:hypothetical protein LPJ64_002512 [Coemansia asiatica]|uniref:Uncharacterized protein n=1 Tax=Coemansia asiatica TaxID=1052880 RepID=A0A9W8CKW7_9FUNG|nr:hypothetical protein LPJ64_002512 [Coemansia asiatica]